MTKPKKKKIDVVKKELGEKSEQFATKIYKEWNWQNVLVGIVLGFVIGCGVKAHDKPTLPPFDSLPKLEQGYIKAKLREAQLLMDMHKVSGNVLRDEMVADMIKKNPALATAIPELQIVFSYLWILQNKRVKVYECNRSLAKQCKVCKEKKSNIGCLPVPRSKFCRKERAAGRDTCAPKNIKCDHSVLGMHNYNPSFACDASYCVDKDCKTLGWSSPQLIANSFLLRGIFLLVKNKNYNNPDLNFDKYCFRTGVDFNADGFVCSKEFDGSSGCFKDQLHFEASETKGFCEDEEKLESGGLFLII